MKPEKRGAKNLAKSDAPKEHKRPRPTLYVHYLAQSGETLAFAVQGATKELLRAKGPCVVPYKVSHKLAPGVRLVELPSQIK